MIRNLKILGLAFVAVFAMGAVVASAQQFHSESAPSTVTGSQEGQGVFTTDAGTIECTTATYKGTIGTTTTTTISMVPTFSGCTAFGGFASAKITTNGCEYLLHITQNGSNTGTMDIACPGSNEITVVAEVFGTVKCTVHIHPKSGLQTVTYTNVGVGATRERIVHLDITNFTYTVTAGTGFGACSTTGTTHNGHLEETWRETGSHISGGTEHHTGAWID